MKKETLGMWVSLIGVVLFLFQMWETWTGHPYTSSDAVWSLILIAAIIVGVFLFKDAVLRSK